MLLESVCRLLGRSGKTRGYLTYVLHSRARWSDLAFFWIDKEDGRQVDDVWRGTMPVLGGCAGGGCGDGLMSSHERWKSPIKKIVGSSIELPLICLPREFVMEHPPMETPRVPSAN
jgi:hypothetical protein